MKRSLGILLFLLLITTAAAAQNTPPSITAGAPVYVTAGDSGTSAAIATVSDAEDDAGSLVVQVDAAPAGISISSITNDDGTVTAIVSATCEAAAGENDVLLVVRDSSDATMQATFVVHVSYEPAPSTPTISATANGTGTSDQACPEQPLTLTASSTGATSFQWYVNNDTINGATSATYSATGTGDYHVTASNSCSTTAHSDMYHVSNPTPHKPFVTANGPLTFCSGGSVKLTSDSATGIQWYRNGVAIAGAGSQSYTVTTSGDYTCILNALGCHSQTSDTFSVFVSSQPSAPTISATQNGTFTTDQACPEQPLTLHFTDSNPTTTSYQWFKDNDTLDGATSNTYVATGSGSYTVKATAPGGCSATSAAYVVQNPTPHKAFLTKTGSTTFCTGGSVTIWSDSATGIQWYRDGVAISGAGSQSYTATQSGSYTAILNALGCHSQESDPIVVTVSAYPDVPTISGTADYACPEQPATLTATSNGATSFQWYRDDEPLSETGPTLVVTARSTYSATATNGTCTTARSSGLFIDNPTPHKAFLTTTGSTTFCTGGSVTIWSDSATGIQWYRDGVAISGAGHQSYTATQSGSYTAILNALGCHSQESDPIVVTVTAYPDVPTISGTADYACPEQPATLTATSNGATSFQWYRDDELLTGETGPTLVVTAKSTYSATATNGTCTTVRSSGLFIDNPTPHKAFLTTTGSTTFCTGSSVTIWSDSATGIQWYRDGVAISGAGHQSYTATQSGSYTAILNALGCHSQESDPVVVTVVAYPDVPTISGTADYACPEQPATLTATSNGATSFQWYRDDELLTGETGSTLIVTATSSYSATATNGTCTTARSAGFAITNPTPHKATLSTTGSTSICQGQSVTIWSDSATGIQWYRDGVAISGANSQSYVATVAGSYTCILNALGCHSQESDAVVVTVNANPDATITAPSVVISSSTGNSASVASAGSGATYAWSISGGTITSGSGTNAIAFTAGAAGTLTLSATVTTAAGCSDTKPASVSVVDPVTVTKINPSSGAADGGTSVTITGTGFQSGASVTFGSVAATSVVVVSSTKITATTPAHAAADVDVKVTNANTASGTLTNGFTYKKAKK